MTYEIHVQGQINSHMLERLGSMINLEFNTTDDVRISILKVELLDQAALAGVLNLLFDMRFPLLYVNCLDASLKNGVSHLIEVNHESD